MHTVTSFHGSAVRSEQLNAVMAEYVALERARIYRRLFVTRFGLLALIVGVIGAGFHWLSAVASTFTFGFCLVVPVWAWVVELWRARRLTRRLDTVSGSTTHIVRSRPAEPSRSATGS